MDSMDNRHGPWGLGALGPQPRGSGLGSLDHVPWTPCSMGTMGHWAWTSHGPWSMDHAPSVWAWRRPANPRIQCIQVITWAWQEQHILEYKLSRYLGLATPPVLECKLSTCLRLAAIGDTEYKISRYLGLGVDSKSLSTSHLGNWVWRRPAILEYKPWLIMVKAKGHGPNNSLMVCLDLTSAALQQ